MIPGMDHGPLSPSGRVSKAARKATLRRETARLFPPGYWDTPAPTEAEARAASAERMLRSAATLRELAARGMKPIAYRREADKLEAEARALGGAS